MLNVKRTDGEGYEPSSLRGFSLNVNHVLKEGKYPVSVINDKEFD